MNSAMDRKKNNSCCSVPQCNTWGKKENISYHKFPSVNSKVYITNKFDEVEKVDQRKAWIMKLRIGKPVSKYMRVCSKHFQPSDFFKSNKKHCLKKNAVPSMNLPTIQHGSVPPPSTLRRTVRNRKSEPERSNVRSSSSEVVTQCVTDVEEQPSVDDIQAAEALLLLLERENDSTEPKDLSYFQNQQCLSKCDISVQVNTPKKLSVCDLITTDKVLNTFTGLRSFNMLNVIVANLKIDQRLHALSTRDRVILTFFKMKHNLSYAILGSLFGISQELCKNYIHSMLPLLASVLRPAINFPSADEIKENMPTYFEDFSNVRVVIDCTEIHIQKPKCLCCRIKFYSQYKTSETVKFMVGVSPAGLITFVSKPYGGRASDKLIFEESDLITKLDGNRDAVMADKGFLIDDICDSFGVTLYRPPFLRNKNQLTADEALLNTKIAAARVHIERVNQRIKVFKILSGKLQWSLVPYINCIFIIACGVTNLSAPILDNKRFLQSDN